MNTRTLETAPVTTIDTAEPAPLDGSDLGEVSEPSDATYCRMVRDGDRSAFDVLYRRHRRSALQFATHVAGRDLAEEHVAEAFARILTLLLAGKGPEENFVAYLFTAIRNSHLTHLRRNRRTDLVEDPYAELPVDLADRPWDQHFADQSVGQAFRDLPERSRIALWLHVVEGRPLAEIGAALGISAGATAQLTYRAREALRVGYLGAHLQAPADPGCHPVIAHLPRHVRGTSTSRGPDVGAHLRSCHPCELSAAELARVAIGLPKASTAA